MHLFEVPGHTIEEVVESYETYLEIKRPAHLQSFRRRMKTNLDAARFEAAMFGLMREDYELDVTVAEDIGEGGADFLCRSDGGGFVLEVTTLDTESVETQSNLPHQLSDDVAVNFRLITHKVRTKVSDKVPQLAVGDLPRVLAIGSFHNLGHILLGVRGAEWLLTGERKIRVSYGGAQTDAHEQTDLTDSVFFRWDRDRQAVVACRQSVSAVLLVSTSVGKCSIVGVLHPEPVHTFDYGLLRDVPFVRLRNWPLANRSRIHTEWVIANPELCDKWLRKIELKDEGLRRIY